jgi:hypothetical protein
VSLPAGGIAPSLRDLFSPPDAFPALEPALSEAEGCRAFPSRRIAAGIGLVPTFRFFEVIPGFETVNPHPADLVFAALSRRDPGTLTGHSI